jgi:quinol monooxygenase YgiN
MPASPWKTVRPGGPDSEFVALVSELPLRSYWRLLPFVVYTAQIVRQLSNADGLAGYSLLARPLSKRFWTLSAWTNEAALMAFVRHPPHVRIMSALAPHMKQTSFVRWTVKGSQMPLRWEDALPRLSKKQSPGAG